MKEVILLKTKTAQDKIDLQRYFLSIGAIMFPDTKEKAENGNVDYSFPTVSIYRKGREYNVSAVGTTYSHTDTDLVVEDFRTEGIPTLALEWLNGVME